MKEISVSLKNQRDKEFTFEKDEYGNIRFHAIGINIDVYYDNNNTEYLIGQIEWFMLYHDFRIVDIITILSRLKYNFNADEEVQKMDGLIKTINKSVR